MRTQLKSTALAILVMAFPLAALADLSGTPTLAANTSLNLDTGATAASGGDVLWSGSTMTPQGKAGVFNVGPLGAAAFSALTQNALQIFPYSSSPIAASTLVADDVFAVKTNGGNYGAVLVTAVSGTSISLQFTTFGVSAVSSGPTIKQLLNNFGLIPAGFPNSGIAQGALLVIQGSGLADPAAQAVLQSSAGSGLPTTLNGASVKVTVNGTTTVPVLYYAIAAQLAVVLPSNTPVGTGQITVTYNNQTSTPFPIQVVKSAMGFDAYYGTGTGLGVATNALTGTLYNYNNSIPPGTTVVLWGSGLGADSARDTTYTPAAFAINNLAHVYVGGVDAQILYQGASGFPGVNQVNITIPASAPTGCNVALVGVTAAGVPTNFTTLPIGTGTCSDPAFGISGSQFQTLSGQSTVKTGFVGLVHSVSATIGTGTQTDDLAVASFQSYTGSIYGAASGIVSVGGGCVVSQTFGTGSSAGTSTGLNAGTIMVTGPGGASTLSQVPQSVGFYYSQLASGFIPMSGGTFAFHGAGGTNVGMFDTSVVFPTPLLTWTNQAAAATIARSTGVQVTWTGGAPSTFVTINGTSVSGTTYGSFTCIAPVSAGQFTVPGYVTSALPAGTGGLSVYNTTNYQTFAASGIDLGISYGYVSYQVNSTYQ
jgi:uncharacterized protein (TIGR03437 family)